MYVSDDEASPSPSQVRQIDLNPGQACKSLAVLRNLNRAVDATGNEGVILMTNRSLNVQLSIRPFEQSADMLDVSQVASQTQPLFNLRRGHLL